MQTTIRSSEIAGWDRMGIRNINAVARKARNDGKWLFVWDCQGSLATFFRYQGVLCDFDEKVSKVQIGQKTATMALEELRETLISCQLGGKNLCLDLGITSPDFQNEYMDRAVFPTELIFDRTEWCKAENRQSFYNSEEVATCQTYLQEEFMMTLRSSVETEEELQQVLAGIPKIEKFHCVVIE